MTADLSIEELAHSAALGVLLDFDGTLVPLTETPAQVDPGWDAEVAEVLAALASAPRTTVMIVSSRPRESLEARVGHIPGLELVAEHGVWRRDRRGWNPLALFGTDPTEITKRLQRLANLYPGSMVERKTWSVCLHYRQVSEALREALIVEGTDIIADWVDHHPEYELLEASKAIEVRHRGANKGTAVEWLRLRLGPEARLIALGDDLTDEDTFAALGADGMAVFVGPRERTTLASRRLSGPTEVLAFLRALARVRLEPGAPLGDITPRERVELEGRTRLVAVSNRVPDPAAQGRKRNVGGLVAALEPALAKRDGLWLGWSGRARSGGGELAVDPSAIPRRATFDFEPRWQELFYNGFSNRSLWPLFHGLLARARYDDEEWNAYREVNAMFARSANRLVADGGSIWIHDYHLMLMAKTLREEGARARLGFFLHIPFPALDLFETIPWAKELLEGLLSHDLVGFHTSRYALNFVTCAVQIAGAEAQDEGVLYRGRFVRVGVFPLGIQAEKFEEPDEDPLVDVEIEHLQISLADRKLVLGVDRLDYTKGIPPRLEAFSRMLELYPAWRGRVSMIQISVPSRADVPEYAEQRRAIESLVGHINGEHGEAHWAPVRYVYRSYPPGHLARLYRAADVGFVTPLRDGMNLVAKEYVAAQDASDPGVLLLSRFAGAAEEMQAALLTNPYHRDGMARDLARALEMPRDERLARHTELLSVVRGTSSETWADEFIRVLESK